MVIVEDVHWADPASMDLINYVARNIAGHPILFILSHRPDDSLPDWSAHPHTISLPLDDLPDEACLEIVRDMIGPVTLPKSLRELVLSKGAGNPFFVEQVVRALIDANALQQDSSGDWQVIHDIETVELPDTIHGIIISRIDRLPQTDQQLLQVASVVGYVFPYHILESVYPHNNLEDTLRRRLDYLSRLGLTEIQLPEEEIYRFKHLTTREVVYDSLAFEQRRGLHRRIADLTEHKSAENITEYIDLLAYHYFEGQSWAKAMEYNRLAARRAQREFANDTAVAAYQRTLEAAAKLDGDTAVEQLFAYEALGEVLTLLGRYDEALDHYTSARAMVEAEPPSADQERHLADLCRETAEVYEKRSEYDAAFKWLQMGLNCLEEHEPTIEAARIYLLGAGVNRRQAKNDEAIDWCLKSLATAAEIKTRQGRQVVAQACYNLGGIYTLYGDLPQAVQFCLESVRFYQEIDDVVGESNAYVNLSNVYSDQGDWNRASNALRKSLAMKQEIGDIFGQGMIANNLANIYLYRGEWDQAASLFEQSHAIWKQVGAAWGEAIVLSNLAQVLIYQENWREARTCLSRSQAIFAEIGSEDYLPELERRWGEFYLIRATHRASKTGDLDQALAHTHRSIELAVAQNARLEEGMSCRVLGQIHLARGEKESAEAALHQSLQILTDLDSQYEAARTTLCVIQLAIENGATAASKAQLEGAIQTFEKLGAQADLVEAMVLNRQLYG
jgi:tetratricopeptide (TPR) repeat protein